MDKPSVCHTEMDHSHLLLIVYPGAKAQDFLLVQVVTSAEHNRPVATRYVQLCRTKTFAKVTQK